MLIHIGSCAFGGKPTREVLLLRLDDTTGALELAGEQTLPHENPGWLLQREGRVVYVAYENEDGLVQGFKADSCGQLTELGPAVNQPKTAFAAE